MKNHPGQNRSNFERHYRKAENITDISHLIVGGRLEIYPAEHQRECDCGGEQATPKKKLMHPPAQARTPINESLPGDISTAQRERADRAAQDSIFAKHFPTSAPEQLRRRFLQPDVIVISDAPP